VIDGDIFFLLCLLIVLVFIALRIPARLKEGKYLRAWEQFAHGAGLDFEKGSFFSGMRDRPALTGNYGQRQVKIKAITEGKYGYRDSILEIEVSVNNQSFERFPTGAFFFVRSNPSLLSIFFDLMQQIDEDHENINPSNYAVISVPINLAHHFLSTQELRKILKRKNFLDIVVEGKSVRARKIGIDAEMGEIEELIGEISDFATSFERFSRAWIR
jgi:hypothetical protein